VNRSTAVVAGALFVALVAAIPVALFLHQPYLISLFGRLAILAIAGVGLNLVLGHSGLPAFGHAAFVGVGAYAVGITTIEEIPFLASGWTQFGLATALGAASATIVGALSLRTRGVAFLMITLAFGQMLFYATMSLERYGGDDGITLPHASTLAGLSLQRGSITLYGLSLAILAVTAYAAWRVMRSPFGTVLKGAAVNERRMQAVGIVVFRYRLGAFALSGAICGLAGALLANHTAYISPASLSWMRSVELAIVVLLGGAGTAFGPLFGAAAFVLLEEVLSGLTEHWRLLFGPLLLFVVLAAPGGIAGLLSGKRDG
jgi:branched-chain amino acid transport system permease protein